MLYEYKCDKCGEHFDEMRAVSSRDIPIKCPHCPDGMGHHVVITNCSFKMGKGRKLTPREVFSKGIKKRKRKGPENIVLKNPHPLLKNFGS
jgi:putative FmdB family regulatory protein